MWDDAKQMNAISAMLALFAVLALLWGGLSWVLRQPAFAFREIVVQAAPERASAAHLEAAIREELTGTFFTMNQSMRAEPSPACPGCGASRCAGSGRSASK